MSGSVYYRLMVAACLLAISGCWASQELHGHRHGHGLTTSINSQPAGHEPLITNSTSGGRNQRRPHRTASRSSRRSKAHRTGPAAYQTDAADGQSDGSIRSEMSWSRTQIPALNGSHLAGQTPFQHLLSAMKLVDGHNRTTTKAEQILKSSKDALIVTKRQYLRSDWCKSQPLIQRVTEDGCLSATVLNQFCYGQCNSFFIPKNIRPPSSHPAGQRQSGDPAFRSCAFCKPKRTSWVSVTLKCPSLMPPIRRRRVQIIKQCRCITEILS
jgi:hypothetical protein